MLIINADVFALPPSKPYRADIRITNGHISAIGDLHSVPNEAVFDAHGGVVLPGLHDHHVHLMSFAASLESVACGPPNVTSALELRDALKHHQAGSGWLRGYGYHESVAGKINSEWLDDLLPNRPLRIQHRSGRLWMLNTAAVQWLQANGAQPGQIPADGRWFDQDTVLGNLIGNIMPPISRASLMLAAYGVTGVTDMTPTNTNDTFQLLADMSLTGDLLQSVTLAGTRELNYPLVLHGLSTGATKVHLHESDLPTFSDLSAWIIASHEKHRLVAIHCVTEAELVFALAAFRESGVRPGDRIEHASVTPPLLIDQLCELGLMVVTQPNFIPERGDAYLEEIPADEHANLYRVASFLKAGISIAGGTDMPFGNADPWLAMQAAVMRVTSSGQCLGAHECVSPEEAIALFLGSADQPEMPRQVTEGAIADLCILNEPWHQARTHLSSQLVAATLRRGELIFNRIDQAPR